MTTLIIISGIIAIFVVYKCISEAVEDAAIKERRKREIEEFKVMLNSDQEICLERMLFFFYLSIFIENGLIDQSVMDDIRYCFAKVYRPRFNSDDGKIKKINNENFIKMYDTHQEFLKQKEEKLSRYEQEYQYNLSIELGKVSHMTDLQGVEALNQTLKQNKEDFSRCIEEYSKFLFESHYGIDVLNVYSTLNCVIYFYESYWIVYLPDQALTDKQNSKDC